MKFRSKKITTSLGAFERAMETDTNIYYIDFSTGISSIRMYDRKMNFIGNDNATLKKDLKGKKYCWLSKKMKEYLEVKE